MILLNTMSKLFPNVVKIIIPFNSYQVRRLPRWSHRRPAQVIPAEEYDKVQDKQIKTEKEKVTDCEDSLPNIKWKQPASNSRKIKNKTGDKSVQYKFQRPGNIKPLTISKTPKNASKTMDMLETIIDEDGNFIYTKMKNNDSRITSILVEVKSKKEKDKKDLILVEGKRLIKDALEAGCKLEYILFSRLKDVEYIRPFLPKLGAKLYKMSYKEIQMWSDLNTTPGLMGIFKIPDLEISRTVHHLPLTVVCDNVREPNNLGSILRTCSGVGCVEVILTKGCVNVWDTKVLRSAMGAHFKLNIKRKLEWNDIRERIESYSSVYIADNNTISTNSDDSIATSHNLANLLQAVPVLPYYGVDFRTNRHIILIIGGETQGISEESYKLATELKGIRLNVPLSNNVDSLNTGTALGIIVFEMRRQLSGLKESEDESVCEIR